MFAVFSPFPGFQPQPLTLTSPRCTAARPLAIFPSDLTPDDIVRARRKALQGEQAAPAAGETPAELRAAMGEIAAQFAAQEGRFATGESALLERCDGLFDERLAAAEPQRAQAVLQAATSLEVDAKREASSLQAEAVRSSLVGDWRLVFTDSPPALKARARMS